MFNQQGFQFDDPDSRTRSGALNVVYAKAERSETFNRDVLFSGFSSMKALTYTSSIPMIVGLLERFDFESFECVFGHERVLSQDAAHILAFQKALSDCLNDGFVAVKDAARRQIVYDLAAQGRARFYVVKDIVAHAKIYLLESAERRRVIVGSANLSEIAFSGRQAETLIVFDDDPIAYQDYERQYEAVRDVSSSHVELERPPIAARLHLPSDIPLAEIPVVREARRNPKGVTLYVPPQTSEEVAFGPPAVVEKVERILPVVKKSLAGVPAPKNDVVSIKPKQAEQIVRIALERPEDGVPQTYMSYESGGFSLSGKDMSLDADADDVRSDVHNWLEFFQNYERGFKGDVARMQRDYFTFMSWFYYSPLLCDLRNAALRRNSFSFSQPMFALLYGSSNCGKTSLIKTLMQSMFAQPHDLPTTEFVGRKLSALQASYKRFPVVFDDVEKSRFDRHGPEIIKNDRIPAVEYPCFALSMNADAKSFKPEVIKRCLMIYTRTSLPNNEIAAMRDLQKSVARIQEELTTGLYREYLKRTLAATYDAIESEDDGADALGLSSNALVDIFAENLPEGDRLPEWCAPVTLEEYQLNAFERPRLQLKQLLHKDNYSRERKPSDGGWTLSGDSIRVQAPMMQARGIKNEIPDWLLDDAASVAGQIVLKKDLVEEFLDERVRRPSVWRNPFGR